MTAGAPPQAADYREVWNALSRRERGELTQAALRGQRPANRWDAAISLWWAQRELRRGLAVAVGIGLGVVALLLVVAWLATGTLPTSVGEALQVSPMLPVLALIPIATAGSRRPKLKRAAQINAATLAGKALASPPDVAEADRLLLQARTKGWFTPTRPTP